MEPPTDRDALVEAALAAARRAWAPGGVSPGAPGGPAGSGLADRVPTDGEPTDGEPTHGVPIDFDASDEGRSILRHARALTGLPRRRAPLSLDGFVVAALEAGARQARVTEHLRTLDRLAAPDVLARLACETVDPLRAPAELADRVSARVSDHGAGAARALVATLSRHPAPPELTDRLAAAGGLLGAPRRRPSAWRAVAHAAGLAAAAVALVVAFAGFHGAGSGDPAGSAPAGARPRLALEFEFVGHERLADLPLRSHERAFVGALVGETVGGGS
jgi:hypothetical protein